MRTDLISIGTEYLTGTLPEPDQNYLAARLAELDAGLRCLKIIADNPEDVKKTLEDSLKEADILIVTGGISYGKDPRLHQIFSELFEKPEAFCKKAFEWMTETVNEKQLQISEEKLKELSVLPQDAMFFRNRIGLMPGFILEKNEKSLIVLPGTSGEIREMFEDEIVGYIYKLVSLGESDIRIELEPGMTAKEVESYLGELLRNDNPEICVVREGEHCTIRVHAIGPTEGDAKILANLMATDCCRKIPEGKIRNIR